MGRATYIFFGLAPVGVCLATIVTNGAGALLPHPFSLTKNKSFPPHQCHAEWFALMRMKPQYGAVYFLLHFPPSYLDWALPSDMLYGARTFLPAIHCANVSLPLTMVIITDITHGAIQNALHEEQICVPVVEVISPTIRSGSLFIQLPQKESRKCATKF